MKKAGKIALILGMTAIAGNAVASPYFGIGGGQSTVGDWLSKEDAMDLLEVFGSELGIVAFNGTVSASSDDKDTGWKIYGGYQFTDNLAIEASYLNYGEATAKSVATGSFLTSPPAIFNGTLFFGAEGEASAFTLDGVGRVGVARWLDLFVKAGIYRAEIDIKLTGGISDGNTGVQASESFSDDSTGVHIGLGADFKLTEHVLIRAEWERLSDVDIDDGETDIDMISLSAAYRF
jgi:OOP family OmpA-OmpF porin